MDPPDGAERRPGFPALGMKRSKARLTKTVGLSGPRVSAIRIALPVAAAGLLGKSRLDWQVSLSGTLHLWIREPGEALTSAELILAWANLGSLIEGSIKLLLSVYYETFKADIDNLKKVNAYNKKKQEPLSPAGLTLEPLRQYCALREILDNCELALVQLVQQHRNAIHAFKDRSIGDEAEFEQALQDYLQMLRNIIARLLYPDDQYVPSE